VSATHPDWDALGRSIGGEVVLPGSPDYNRVRRPFITRFDDMRPGAVVRCTSPADVAQTLTFGRATGSRRTHSSGCGSEPFPKEQSLDRARSHLDTELAALPLDPHVALPRVALRHPDHELAYLRIDRWSSRSLGLVGSVATHELAMPAEQGGRRDDEA
jgi:hypothetical protein